MAGFAPPHVITCCGLECFTVSVSSDLLHVLLKLPYNFVQGLVPFDSVTCKRKVDAIRLCHLGAQSRAPLGCVYNWPKTYQVAK